MTIAFLRSVGGVVVGKSLAGAGAATLLAAVAAAATPTTASAFDLQGLIGTAMALQYGAYHGGGGYVRHHAKSHVASRSDGDTDTDSVSAEKDALDVDATATGGAKVVAHRAPGPSQSTEQASVPDLGADKMAADAPAFNPSR